MLVVWSRAWRRSPASLLVSAQAPLTVLGRQAQLNVAAFGQPALPVRVRQPWPSRTRSGIDVAKACPPNRTRSAASVSVKGVGAPPSPRVPARALAFEHRDEVEGLGPDADLVALVRTMTQIERARAAADAQAGEREALEPHRLGRHLQVAGDLEPGARELERLDLDRARAGTISVGRETAGLARGLAPAERRHVERERPEIERDLASSPLAVSSTVASSPKRALRGDRQLQPEPLRVLGGEPALEVEAPLERRVVGEVLAPFDRERDPIEGASPARSALVSSTVSEIGRR